MTGPAPRGEAPARRVLLDECVPRRLTRHLPGLDAVHLGVRLIADREALRWGAGRPLQRDGRPMMS